MRKLRVPPSAERNSISMDKASLIEDACWPNVTTMDLDPPVDKTAFAHIVVSEFHAVDSAAETPTAIADVNS
jgi:hypothetical protein